MPSAYTSDTALSLVLDTAVLSIEGVPWGVSLGGVRVEPLAEIRNAEFDGKVTPIASLDRVTSHGLRFTGRWLEFATRHLEEINHRITSTLFDGNTRRVFTPRDAGGLLAYGHLAANVVVEGRRSDGGFVRFTMVRAKINYAIEGTHGTEAVLDMSFEARVDIASLSTDHAPWFLSIVPANTNPVASVEVVPATFALNEGQTQQFAVVLRDAFNQIITGRPVAWSSSHPSRMSITTGGFATALAGGAVTITAEAEGVQGTSAGSVTALSVSDSFNRANSTSSLGVADTGEVWTAHAGTWGIINNTAYCYLHELNGARNVATVPTSYADGVAQVTFLGTSGRHRLVFRFVDVNNYWFIERENFAVTLFVVEGGAHTAVAGAAVAQVSGEVYAAVLDGTGISIRRNGAQITSHTSAIHQTATRHGIGMESWVSGDNRPFDDFSVGPL